MADITPPVPEGRQLIQSYGGGGFRIAGRVHAGSVLVTPDRTLPWPVTAPAAIDLIGLQPLLTHAADDRLPGSVLLVGTGTTIVPVPHELRAELRRLRIGVELMDTGAACRTFNILLTEERAVMAALIAVE